MDEQLIPPLFAHNEPGDRYDAYGVAELISSPGFSVEKAVVLVRRLARDRLIEVRSNAKNRNWFAPADAAATIVHRALLDSGIANSEVSLGVSRALYAWQPGQRPQAYHPITVDDHVPRRG